MNKEIIFSMNTAFRGEFNIHGYSYGRGDKAACIVGSMRGNEYQQLYMCSLLAQRLAEIEAQGDVVAGKEILLIPTLNYSSMNAEKKNGSRMIRISTVHFREISRVLRQAGLRRH